MNYLKRIFTEQTGLKISKTIDSSGGIYQLKDYPNRVVKINVDGNKCYGNIFGFFNNKKNLANPCIVKIYDFGKIKGEFAYYYIMEKLSPIDVKEQRAFVDCFESLYSKGRRMTKNGNLSFITPKFKSFLQNSFKLKQYYNDVHEGNIMKDRYGNYKFIDIESFYL